MASDNTLTLGYDTDQRALLNELAVQANPQLADGTPDDIEDWVMGEGERVLMAHLAILATQTQSAQLLQAENERRRQVEERIAQLLPEPEPELADITEIEQHPHPETPQP